MSLVPSLRQAIGRVDGEALVMHAGDKPYVVSPTGQVDLSSRGLPPEAAHGSVAPRPPPAPPHATAQSLTSPPPPAPPSAFTTTIRDLSPGSPSCGCQASNAISLPSRDHDGDPWAWQRGGSVTRFISQPSAIAMR